MKRTYTTVHCTYPDGNTSEARYGYPVAGMLALYDDFQSADTRTLSDVAARIARNTRKAA